MSGRPPLSFDLPQQTAAPAATTPAAPVTRGRPALSFDLPATPRAPAAPPAFDSGKAANAAVGSALTGADTLVDGVGQGLGKAIAGAVQPFDEAANAAERLLPKKARKKVEDAKRRTGSGIQEVGQFLGTWQDALGGSARDLQQGGLKQFAAGPELGKVADAVKAALTSGDAPHALERVNERYQLFSPATLEALRDGNPGAIASVAGTLRAHPHLAGLASFATEMLNPLAIGGGKIAEGVAKVAAPAARAVVANTPALRDVSHNIGRAFNRYHEVQKADTPQGVQSWALQHEASLARADHEVDKQTVHIFGGLTTPQKVDLVHRFEARPKGQVLSAAPADPKHLTMDERVDALVRYQEGLDARSVAEHPDLLPNKSEANFFSRRGTTDEPVYRDDRNPDRLIEEPRGAGSRGPLGAPVAARASGFRKTKTLKEMLDSGAVLDPTFDPARQFSKASKQREHAIAVQRSFRELESVPAGVDDRGQVVGARAPLRYEVKDAQGNIIPFADEKGLRAYAERAVRPRALAETLADNGVTQKPRVPLNAQALRGMAAATAKAGARSAKVGEALQRAEPRMTVNASTIADAVSPQSTRVANFAADVAGVTDARKAVNAEQGEYGAAIRDLRAAHRDARKLERGHVYESGEGKAVDALAGEIAARRIDAPAGTSVRAYRNESTGEMITRGSSSSFAGTNYTKQEVDDVRVALDRARKAKPPTPGVADVKPTKATRDDAVRLLDEHMNATGQARGNVEEMLRKHDPESEKRLTINAAKAGPTIKRILDEHEYVNADAARRAKGLAPLPPRVTRGARGIERGQAVMTQRISAAMVDQQAKLHNVSRTIVKQVADSTQDFANETADLLSRAQMAKYDEKLRDKINREMDSLVNRYATNLVEKGKLGPSGLSGSGLSAQFAREKDLGIGTVDGVDKVLHKSVYNFVKDAQEMGAPKWEATSLGHFFTVTGHLARAGIVLWPTTHIIWNLGRAFLAEGGDVARLFGARSAIDEGISANVLARDGMPQGVSTWGELADRMGAAPSMHQGSFGLGSEKAATIQTTPGRSLREMLPGAQAPGKLSRLGSVDRVLTRGVTKTIGGRDVRLIPGWNDNQHLVFGVFERRYAAELMRKFVGENGMDVASATRRVRQALGDSNNVTSFERQFSRAFFFYPWMKTVIPFWAKKGFFDWRQWNAPMTAIRQTNENENDPMADAATNPWRVDLWKNADGGFTTLGIPDPARVTNVIGTAARAPLDFARGITGRDEYGHPKDKVGFEAVKDDLAPAADYVRGHLNPLVALVPNVVYGGNQYQRLDPDPNAPPGSQLGDAVKQFGASVAAPIAGIGNAIHHPAASALALGTGGFVGVSKPLVGAPGDVAATRMRAVKIRQLNHEITRLRVAGDYNGIAQLQSQIRDLRSGISVQPGSMAPLAAPTSNGAAASNGRPALDFTLPTSAIVK